MIVLLYIRIDVSSLDEYGKQHVKKRHCAKRQSLFVPYSISEGWFPSSFFRSPLVALNLTVPIE